MKQNNNLCLTFQNKRLEKSYMDDSIIKKVEFVMAERGLNNTSLGRKLGVSGDYQCFTSFELLACIVFAYTLLPVNDLQTHLPLHFPTPMATTPLPIIACR